MERITNNQSFTENTNAFVWKDEYAPKLMHYNTSETTKLPSIWDTIIVLCDVSGSTKPCSTNSFGEPSRHGHSRHSVQITSETKEPTKSILYAEEEGISIVCEMLANTYNLAKVKTIMASFSTNTYVHKDSILENSNNMYIYAKNIDHIMGGHEKEFGGTNLQNAFEMLFRHDLINTYGNTLLVIASDGRPDNFNNMPVIMENICKQFKTIKKNLDVFCIGAGSIQNSETGRTVSVSTDGNRNSGLTRNNINEYVRGNPNVLVRSGTSSTIMQTNTQHRNNICGQICDKKLLEFCSEIMSTRAGAYSGAYNDYSDLRKAFNSFTYAINTFVDWTDGNWFVSLDGNKMPLNDDFVNVLNTRHNDNPFGHVRHPSYGDYILFRGNIKSTSFQLHVVKTSFTESENSLFPNEEIGDCHVVNYPKECTKYLSDYTVLQGNTALIKDIYFRVLNNDGTIDYYTPDKIENNSIPVFRIRPLIWESKRTN